MSLSEDRALLEEIDNHPEPCNGYESDRLDRLMRRVRGGRVSPGQQLQPHDRKWALDLLEQLDRR